MTGIRTASQTVVVVAMGLVSIAGAVALYQHAALPGPVAATTALAVYLLLLTGHMLAWRASARKGGTAGAARAPARDRREQEVRRMKDETRAAPAVPPLQAAPAARNPLKMPPPAQPSLATARGEAFGRPSAPAGGEPQAGPSLPGAARTSEPPRAMPPPLPPQQAAAPAAPNDDQDFWSYRPTPPPRGTAPLPPFVTGRISGRPTEPTLPDPAAAPRTEPAAKQPRESDVEAIQDAIKRLIEDVNASERPELPMPAQEASHQAGPAVPPKSPQAAVDQSIEALRMTAGTMRSALGEAAPQPGAARGAAPQPPPLPPFVRPQQPQHAKARPASPSDTLARQMADAISAGRIDVALEPILGLEDQQTRHYEVSVRLRDASGHPIALDSDGPDLRGTGLLPLFDGVRITRTAAVARRLEERGKGGSVFSAFSGESVADEHFLGEMAETLHQRGSLATQLVLTFTQSDVRGFSTPEWDSLADMRALGFRFAVSHLTDLEMDFEALAEQGFAFVKLDAEVFLSGMPAPTGQLPSSDVCRHLASHGLALVVDGIESDEQLARVFGFGVLLGQGQLFGGARPVRAEVVENRRTATAAA